MRWTAPRAIMARFLLAKRLEMKLATKGIRANAMFEMNTGRLRRSLLAV
jgi:hypothetical protein